MQLGCCLHFLLRCGAAHTCCPSVAKPSPCNNHTSAIKVRFIGKWMNGLRNCCSTPSRATQILRACHAEFLPVCSRHHSGRISGLIRQAEAIGKLRFAPFSPPGKRSDAGGTMGLRSQVHRSARSGGSLGGAAAPRHQVASRCALSWRADRACRLFSDCHRMFPCRFNAACRSTGCLGSSIGRAVDS